MDPTRRLLFWFKVPYVVDVALVLVGIGLLLGGRSSGWWVLVFAAVRALIGTVALFWLAPRMINRSTGPGAIETSQTALEPDASDAPHEPGPPPHED